MFERPLRRPGWRRVATWLVARAQNLNNVVIADSPSPVKIAAMVGSIPFTRKFAVWLDASLVPAPPQSVRAFAFGLSQRELSFVVELIGTEEFQKEGTRWIWSELWTPDVAKLIIPSKISCDQLSECIRQVRTAIRHYLAHGTYASRLKKAEGIAIEALGHSYDLLWARDEPERQALLG